MRPYIRMQWIGLLTGLATFLPVALGQELNLSPTFAGHALALQVTPWEGEPVALVQTGPVPRNGGERQNSRTTSPPIPGVWAYHLYAVTLGAGSQNRSQASLSFLDVRIGDHHITALWVESEATATVGFLNVPTNGKFSVDGLTVDGQLVKVTGEANQTITFPDGFLIINEQTGLHGQHIGTLTVNALHLLVDGAGSMIAASSTAEVINAPTRNPVP